MLIASRIWASDPPVSAILKTILLKAVAAIFSSARVGVALTISTPSSEKRRSKRFFVPIPSMVIIYSSENFVCWNGCEAIASPSCFFIRLTVSSQDLPPGIFSVKNSPIIWPSVVEISSPTITSKRYFFSATIFSASTAPSIVS